MHDIPYQIQVTLASPCMDDRIVMSRTKDVEAFCLEDQWQRLILITLQKYEAKTSCIAD